jgi:exonuclease SbcD
VAADSAIRVTSRDGAETATIAALPWVPERLAVEYETLFEAPDKALQQYGGRLETAIARCSEPFSPSTINVFLGHMLVSGAVIAQGGGERKLHVGDNFAVQPSSLPKTAQYVALGHIHKMQQMAASAPSWYAGSLLQLDFGEAGQDKFVNIVDIHPKQPAEINPVQMTGGRGLRALRLKLDELPQHADRYGDDYLRVTVELDAPATHLYERVREFLPNALDVQIERTDEPAPRSDAARSGLAPHELLARYYRERVNADVPKPIVDAFNELYEAETGRAAT